MSIWKIDEHGIFISTVNTEISYPEDGNMECYDLEDSSPWFRFRNELIGCYLEKYSLNSGDFLDVGGGNGFQVRYIAEQGLVPGKAVLVEPGYLGCLNAKNRGCEFVYCGIFQDFPWEEYSIAMIGLFDVIEHIENDILFLNDLYDRLPQGARLFINVPAKRTLWSSVDVESGHFRRYEENDLDRITTKTRFKVLDWSYYFKFYELPLFAARVVPERLGIFRKNDKDLAKVMQANNKNLRRGNEGLLASYFSWRHRKSIEKIRAGEVINSGTSLFFVLEK